MDEHYAAAQKIVEDAKRENKEREEKSNHNLERLEDLSIQNFASWREYLHKYFSIVFILIGATGFLQQDYFYLFYFKLGLWVALAGVFFGYIIINIYFYIERRWFQGSNLLSGDIRNNQFTHPEMKTDDLVESLVLYNQDFSRKLEERLEKAIQEKNKAQVKYLKRMIKRNKKITLTFYFIGQHFDLVERIWVVGMSLSVLLTMVGVLLMFVEITNY